MNSPNTASAQQSSSGSPERSRPGRGHALVIGASVAGLLAARCLREHFGRVTLIERDTISSEPASRKGVPQGLHTHVFLGAGLYQVLDWFPTLLDELLQKGAVLGDFGRDAVWFHYGIWKRRVTCGLPVIQCTRTLLEWALRTQLLAAPGCTLQDQTAVQSLLFDDSRGRVTGVRIADKRNDGALRELAADLVVDASGRGSQAPTWLTALGYERPHDTEIRFDLTYASRMFQIPDDYAEDWSTMIIYPRPPQGQRAGVIYPVEGRRWMVSMCGYLGDAPPATDEGFLDFARNLARPDIYERIRSASAISPIAIHKIPLSRRRHFEKLPRLPDGFVILGDAVCCLNPIFGQGMSVASQSAALLSSCIGESTADDLRGLPQRFQRRLSKLHDLPWLLASSEDLRYAGVVGHRPPWLPVLNFYKTLIMEASSRDPHVLRALAQVLNLLGGLTPLFRPRVVWAALRCALQRLWLPLAARGEVGAIPPPDSDRWPLAALPGLLAAAHHGQPGRVNTE